MERIFRRIQMVEYHWRQKAEAKRLAEPNEGKLDPLTKDLMAGNRGETGTLLLCPALRVWMKTETAVEVDQNKNERKLREERAAAKAAAEAAKKKKGE